MGGQELKKAKKHICVGLLAHVDAGKTTLSEGMLYLCGSIRRLGRVDKRDTFLDTYGQERERGITIFSKQALLETGDTEITLLDTPGHVDFSAEMERTLQVMDGAVLVISGSDGVQAHTLTLWRLLKHYQIPVFLFVNKMDQPDTDKAAIMANLREQLSEYCVDFSEKEAASSKEKFYENIAVCEEDALNEFLETGEIGKRTIQRLTGERKIFPCFFGSALKLFGVEELLRGLDVYTHEKEYPQEFGARVFKISRDEQGNRLTHMKIMGGSLKAKETLTGVCRIGAENGKWEEKVNQIRIYSGEKFQTAAEVSAGGICAVTGLTKTRAGDGLGFCKEPVYPELSPVLCYGIVLPEGCDAAAMLPKLRQIEEEEPQLHIVWDGNNREIKAQVMGQVQIEVYRKLIQERFGVCVDFGEGNIVYKETIADTVEGVGHFEPLRHYAEVHLLMEPGEPGSGICTGTDCSEDELDLNWQRLILSHIEEKEHVGVLMGAPITDMKITLKAGRAHQKHTEGGDFRQAVYRALRQGLMQAKSILLEPYYEYKLEVPERSVGRAMNDLDKMQSSFTLEQDDQGMSILRGTGPMVLLQGYQAEVASYTRGQGRLYCSMKGYSPCHNTEEVLEAADYDPLRDVDNPAGSVFCAHGAGFLVEWDQVPEYMHLESCLKSRREAPNKAGELWEDGITGDRYLEDVEGAGGSAGNGGMYARGRKEDKISKAAHIGQEEIDEILSRTFHANKKGNRAETKAGWKRSRERTGDFSLPPQTRVYKAAPRREEYLLVDGYNVIFAWEELKELAEKSLDGARGKLLDLLCNYQAVRGCSLIAVFDAYRLAGHPTEVLDYHNIHVVYTKEAETADQYIEKFAHENSQKYDVTVATSDGLEQIIIIGEGCKLISSRELKEEMERSARKTLQDFKNSHPEEKNSFERALPPQAKEEMEQFRQMATSDPKKHI